MTYLLDAVVILIFLLAVFVGYKRGFIKTVTGVVAFAAALIMVALVASPVASWFYDATVEPSITATVDEKLAAAEESIAAPLDTAFDALPTTVKNLLAQTGVTGADGLEIAPKEEGDTLASTIVGAVRPVLLPLVEAVCSLILFLLTFVLVLLLLKVLDVVARLPLLRQLNKALGVVGGVVSGALWALFAVSVIQVIAALGSPDCMINLAVVNDTTVVSSLMAINPFAGTLAALIQ